MGKISKIPIGEKFNLLTVIEDAGRNSKGRRLVKCKCDCGNTIICILYNLNRNAKSCGCIHHRNKYATKEIRSTPLYEKIISLWRNIKSRCYNKKNKSYVNYGMRGIEMCEDWRYSFISFYNWCIANGFAGNLELDRIDNNSGYFPKNCRFVTKSENQRNKRTNKVIEIDGVNKTLIEWSEINNFPSYVLANRIKRNWPISKLFLPVNKNCK